jgi:hypothetical protein
MLKLYKNIEDAELVGMQTCPDGRCQIIYRVGGISSHGYTPDVATAHNAIESNMDVRPMFKHLFFGWQYINK